MPEETNQTPQQAAHAAQADQTAAQTQNQDADKTKNAPSAAQKSILGGAASQGTSATPKDSDDGKDAGGGTKQPEVKEPEENESVYDIKTPEGMSFADGAVEEFTALAKEVKLPPEAAQKLIDLEVKYAREQAQKTTEAWKEQAQKLAHGNEPVIARAMTVCGEDLSRRIEEAGVGDHPLFVEMALAFGRALGEDKSVSGKSAAPAKDKTFAQALYGTDR